MNINVRDLIVGQLSSNCYLVFNEDDLLIIDPGDDAEYIKDAINSIDIKPSAIITTHGHFDHVMAANELQLVYEIPFIIHKKDEFLVKRVASTASYFIGENEALDPKISAYIDTEIIFKDNKWFEVIETPGHTPGSVCLYNKKNNIIFAGDLIFDGGGVGRTDYQYGDSELLMKSIKKILKLPEDTIVYSGHGKEFTIADFKNSIYNLS